MIVIKSCNWMPHTTPCHRTHKNKKIVPHAKNRKNARVYKVCVQNEIAKILKRVLSPYLYTHVCTHAHSHTRTHIHVCDTWRSHTPPRGTTVLSMSRQLPHHHAMIKLFFIHFNSK